MVANVHYKENIDEKHHHYPHHQRLTTRNGIKITFKINCRQVAQR